MSKTVRVSLPGLGAGAALALVLAMALSACEPSVPADGSHKIVAAQSAPAPMPAPEVTEALVTSVEEPAPVAPLEPEAVAPSAATPVKAPPTVQVATPSVPTPQPVKATLQPGVLPQGAGRNVAQRLCGVCHSLVLVTANGHTETEWDSIVARMETNGMQASADDINTVIDYLSMALPPR